VFTQVQGHGWAVQTSTTYTFNAEGKAFTTIEMKTSFIRAVREGSGQLTAEGVVLHVGGNIATSEGKIYDDQKRLVAHGSETCMIWNAGEARS